MKEFTQIHKHDGIIETIALYYKSINRDSVDIDSVVLSRR